MNHLRVANDRTPGLISARHIFTADTGDYFRIADSVPQREERT